MRRRHNPHIDWHRRRGTERVDFLLLKHAQELSLKGCGHVADFVEKDGPAVR